MGSLWSVLEEREAELSGLAESLREQLAGVEQSLARLVIARERYQELMSAPPPGVPGASEPVGLERPAEPVVDRIEALSGVMRETIKVFQVTPGDLNCRAVTLGLGLAGTPAQVKLIRARVARLLELGVLIQVERGRYRLAGAAR